MKTTIGIYNSHEEAVDAVKTLTDAGFPPKQLSLIGRMEDENRIMNTLGKDVGVGVALGTTIGILTGVGIFAIPGLGFLYGAGALVGAIAGFDFGLLGSGIISAFTLKGVQEKAAEHYEQQLKEGKFLIIAQGSEEEVSHARDILHGHGAHVGLDLH